MSTEHTIHAFDKEFEKLDQLIARMGGLVEEQLAAAVDALLADDADAARRVVAADAEIDDIEVAIDVEAVRMLALRQPVASDLRSVIAALKIASILERMGDYAANVAKRTTAIARTTRVETVDAIPALARLVQANTRLVLDAYLKRDADIAHLAWQKDKEIDELYSTIYRDTLSAMAGAPDRIDSGTHTLFIAKNIERIGDHATNVAEVVFFMVKGRQLPDSRPKGDTSSFTVMKN